MLKAAAIRKLRRKHSRKPSVLKTLGISALAGVGMYRLVKNHNLLQEFGRLNIKKLNMVSENNLQQCINQCKGIIQELKSLQNNEQDIVIKSSLGESAHHLNMCLQECQYALTQISSKK